MLTQIRTPDWIDVDLPCVASRMVGVVRSPEMRLVAAVLEEALRGIERHSRSHRRPRRAFREAYAWFFDDDQDGPFAFETVSELLGLDAAAVREQVRRRLVQPAPRRRRPAQEHSASIEEDAA